MQPAKHRERPRLPPQMVTPSVVLLSSGIEGSLLPLDSNSPCLIYWESFFQSSVQSTGP